MKNDDALGRTRTQGLSGWIGIAMDYNRTLTGGHS